MANIIATLSVCESCRLHHTNGECGRCYDDCDHDGFEPLNRVDARFVALGDEEYGYCISPCQGCGSDYHGDRFEMVEFDS